MLRLLKATWLLESSNATKNYVHEAGVVLNKVTCHINWAQTQVGYYFSLFMNDGVQKFTKLMLLILPCKGNALNKIKIALKAS